MVEAVQDIQPLTVMFAIMRCLKAIGATYNISFEEVMTDNEPEFDGNMSNFNKEDKNTKTLITKIAKIMKIKI